MVGSFGLREPTSPEIDPPIPVPEDESITDIVVALLHPASLHFMNLLRLDRTMR
jgi:hypothetical protein